MIAAFFMPVFFGLSGLSADLTVIVTRPDLLLFTGIIIAIASLGKFIGAFAGAELGGLRFREGVALGCAMNARGSTEVVVASIGLSIGALTQNLYTMIVTMAMLTTLAMPPMLRAALRRVPMREEEETRIAREELDEKGFLPRLERLLLAVDDSAAGKFTARLAGLVAGAHGMPVTIVKLDETEDRPPPFQGSAAGEVKTGAKLAASRVKADAHEPDPEKVHLTERMKKPEENAPADMVRDEVRKGYDMLLIGVKTCCDQDGGFTPLVSKLAGEFNGSIALLSPGSENLPVLRRGARLLVAVNGTEPSRNAAELTFALARATGAGVTAVYAAVGGRARRTRTREEELLKDMVELAERYDVPLQSRIATRGDAARAILTAAARHDLIVMGVSVRPGEDLFLGNTATQVMADDRKPVLFLASKATEARPQTGEEIRSQPDKTPENPDSTAA
jgi:nucleotide-binding universal stress UspA family protein